MGFSSRKSESVHKSSHEICQLTLICAELKYVHSVSWLQNFVLWTWSSITKAKFQNSFVLSYFFLITFLSLLLILSNDVQLNPGPNKDSSKRSFSIAHWKLNSIAAQNFVKSGQLEAYYTVHSSDIICLSET